MVKYLREILIIALVIWIASTYIFNPTKDVTITRTNTEYVPYSVEVDAVPQIKWYSTTIKDTAQVSELNALIDSLQREMNKKIDSTGQMGEYIAQQDTVIKDTTGEKIADVDVKIISRIPLDPKLRLLYDFTLYNKTTTISEVTYKRTFWQRFGISAQAGIGYGWFNKTVDAYTGVGFHFVIN